MKYIRMTLAFLACCMVSGCIAGESPETETVIPEDLVTEESVSDDVVSGQDLEEEASPEDTDGEAAAEITPEEAEQNSEETVWPEQTISDAGEVVYGHNEYTCEDCGEKIAAYYVESVILSTEVIPCAEQINEILLEGMESEIQLCENSLERFLEGHQSKIDAEGQESLCDKYHYGDMHFFTDYFTGATQYVFEREGEEDQYLCLEVDFEGYGYWGGVHGMPFKETNLFDLNDGSIVSVGDIVNISEEEYRTLVAKYTVEDFREDGEKYFIYEEDSIYEFVDNTVGFDFLMHFSEEGIVIEYSPYELGCFGAGFIPVTIPYEELGIRLVDAYGVDIVPSDGKYCIDISPFS